MERFLDYFDPRTYFLNLAIDRTKEAITGKVEIYGSVHAENVKFHAVGLDIKYVEYYVEDYSGREAKAAPCKFSYDGKVISIPTTPEIAPYFYRSHSRRDYVDSSEEPTTVFIIEFSTKLNRNMQGCYLSTYRHAGIEKRIATTQFESHYARECFPCIDEPAAKASFMLNLTIPDLNSEDVVLSNTPLTSHHGDSFQFETTPKMSTYLLAWVVGPFQSIQTVNRHGVQVASYCALNQPIESLIFANNTAARALDYYNEQFGVKYPLKKLDQVALPDFEAGAMENWGLVTYRESCMLADSTATMEAKQSVAVTVTHELSHQWFGDLVTMEWWDDLWLNESFATMMEFYCTDALYPEFNVWQDFFTTDCVAALKRDSLPGVQAVKQAVHDPAEIATLFDSAIVYAKGARLMLMLNRLIGQDNFLRGLRYYFDKYQYRNTVGDDLWSALQPYVDFDIKKFMHTWLSQPGYPEVWLPEQDVMSHEVQGQDLKQQRFLIDGKTDDTKWPLPEVKDDMSGHYLINLSDTEFHTRLEHFGELDMEQKLRLLIDRMFLARTPTVESSSLLDLIPKFASETSAPVWSILTNIIGDLKLFCPPETPAAKDYQQYLLHTFKTQLDNINYTELSELSEIQLRDALLNIAHYAEDEAILRRLADLYHDDFTKIDPELRAFVLSAKLHFDEATIFPIFLQQYQKITDPELRSDLLFVLASFAKEPAHLDQLMRLLEQPEIVRPQDHIFLYIYLLRNHRTRDRVLDWITTKWSYVKQLTGDKSIEDYLRYAAALIRTPDEAKKFYDFFDQKSKDPILGRSLQMAHIEIDARLQLIAHDTADVHKKLAELRKEWN